MRPVMEFIGFKVGFRVKGRVWGQRSSLGFLGVRVLGFSFKG